MSGRQDYSITDEELFKGIQEDHEIFLEKLYDRYWTSLYQMSYHTLRSEEDAKDIVQEIFISFWLRRHEIQITTTIKAYLFTAARYKVLNKAQELLKSRRIHTAISDQVVESFFQSVEPLDTEELENTLDKRIATLPPALRKVIKLRKEEQLTTAEMAERLQLSEQTVKNQLTSARKKILLLLQESPLLRIFLMFI